jgi:4'-phosphopantetheinyl transferase
VTVDLWRIPLDRNPLSIDTLSHDEQIRADRYKIPTARSRFIATRSALRLILAGYTGQSPTSLIFHDNDFGKPSLGDSPIHFNLSHSADLALLVIANVPIGVDLEQIRPIDLKAIAPTVFTRPEREYLDTLTGKDQIEAFFRLWTLKEAWMKARGEGFRLAHRFSIDLTGPRLFHPESPDWSLGELSLASPYVGAFALHSPALPDVQTFDFKQSL